jgi:hypothetical protein
MLATHPRRGSAPRSSSPSATSVKVADPSAGETASVAAASREDPPKAHHAHPAPITISKRNVRIVERTIVEGSDGASSPGSDGSGPITGTFVAIVPSHVVRPGVVIADGSRSSPGATKIARGPGGI